MTKHASCTTLRIGEYDLGIVETLRVEQRDRAGLWLSASREPVAVLVMHNGATRAYGVDGEPVSLEALRARLPRASWKAVGIEPPELRRD